MKIEYNQNYHLEIVVDQVPNKQLYRLRLKRIDPMVPKYDSTDEYYFESHQLKAVAQYLNEVANAIN